MYSFHLVLLSDQSLCFSFYDSNTSDESHALSNDPQVDQYVMILRLESLPALHAAVRTAAPPRADKGRKEGDGVHRYQFVPLFTGVSRLHSDWSKAQMVTQPTWPIAARRPNYSPDIPPVLRCSLSSRC
jgi:hypothetical protein